MHPPATVMTGRVRASVVLFVALAAACGTSEGAARDSATRAASGGIIADSGAVPMLVGGNRLTRERLDGWRGAQRAVSQMPDDGAFQRLDASAASDADVDRAVEYLGARPAMREAIERSGLTVRDYVLTTLALAQAERSLSGSADTGARPEERAWVSEYRGDLHGTGTPHRFNMVALDERDDDRVRVGRDDGDSDSEGKGRRKKKHGRDRGRDKH